MRRILFTSVEALAAGIFLIPLFLHLQKVRGWNRKDTLWYLLFALYLSGVYDVAGLPNILYHRYVPRVNLEPFMYMFSDLGSSMLNVLLFIPMGFLLPVLWQKYRNMGQTLLTGLCSSVLIEGLQLFTFRATDINDLMTNTLGTLLGYASARIAICCFPGFAPCNKSSELPLIVCSVLPVMFFLQVFVSEFRWSIL